LLLFCKLLNFRWKFLVHKIATFHTKQRWQQALTQNGKRDKILKNTLETTRKIKYSLNILLLILTLISCKNHQNSELKNEIAQIHKSELNIIMQTDSISELWNLLVFEKGGCLGGEQYISEKEFKKEERQLVFSEMNWKKFSDKDKGKLTDFLINKLSDTTKTKIHTCPFFAATNGEMAVYSLQHIHNKNWFDFSEFIKYKDKEYKSAIEQPQVWLQNILKNETGRKKIAKLFKNELKK
jgi:hypothetical protein